VASAESGDDSIYNMSWPTTKKFSFLLCHEEKNIQINILCLVIFTRIKKLTQFFFLLGFSKGETYIFSLSNKRYFSGSKKRAYYFCRHDDTTVY